MTALLLGLTVAINLSFDARAQERGLGARLAEDDALVDRGSQLFGAHCALCHGESGRGVVSDGPQAGPSLIGVGAASTDFMLRTGRMPMDNAQDRLARGRPQFDDQDRLALIAFIESLAPGQGPDIPDITGYEDASLSRGLELFTANCAACHGATAQGVAVGQRDVSSPLDVASPLEIAQAVRSGPGVMPRFSSDVMDDEDLKAVVAWTIDLRQRAAPGGWSFGRSGPVTEGLIAFVVGIGLLLVVMYLLGEKSRDEVVPIRVDTEEPHDGDT